MHRCLLFLALIFASCAPAPPSTEDDRPRDGSDSYFPLTYFIREQYALYFGEPFTVERILSLNGKRDSSTVRAATADWAAITRPFFAADISPKRFIGRYEYSQFDDLATSQRIRSYEAKEPGLRTRQLLVNTDLEHDHLVRSIFIATREESFWSTREQKLYYMPGRNISIGETTRSRLGPDKDMHAEYRFSR